MVVKVDTSTRTHADDKPGSAVDEGGSKWAPDAGSGSGKGPFAGGLFPDMASYSRFCHTLQQPGWTRTEADTQLIADGLARCVHALLFGLYRTDCTHGPRICCGHAFGCSR